ncbi:MAG: galactokinase family protein [Acidobacteriaceae bacterium]|nr:galactokinase family protein [Acidobacteriaceae bacterium]
MKKFSVAISEQRGEGKYFSAASPIHMSRAPGRLDLMGGNVDYTGGVVFQSTIREATWAAAQKRDDRRIVLWNPQVKAEGWIDQVAFEVDEIANAEAVKRLVGSSEALRWTSYVLGVIYFLCSRYAAQANTGISVYLASEVPLNKGVSSSAAVEVATMKAAAACYGIVLDGIDLAEACQWVENVIADSACGIMDQAASVLGDEGYVLPLLCQPCLPMPLVKLSDSLKCWAIDSGVRHAVTGIEYEAARAAAFVGYRMICEWEGLSIVLDDSGRVPRYMDSRWQGYLSNIAPSVFRSKYEQCLPEYLSGEEILAMDKVHPDPFTTIRPGVKYRVRSCTRYAIEENERIKLFVELARASTDESGDKAFRQMGELMFQSHWSYTECGLGCEATDQIIQLVREYAGDGELYGAKITGGGAGGTVAILGSSKGESAFRKVVAEYGKLRSFEPYVFEGSSMGADRFGTKLFEETL